MTDLAVSFRAVFDRTAAAGHPAAELVSRFSQELPVFPTTARSTNTARLRQWTKAGFAETFAHQARVRPFGSSGEKGREIRGYDDELIAASATDTSRIQELHVVTYHAIGALLEERVVAGRRPGFNEGT